MADQFDISPEKRKILEEKAQRRLALRNEFLKQASDPYRHASGEGGTVFDPAFYRYQALRVSGYEYFKANAKTSRIGFLYVIVPLFGFGYLLQSSRAEAERKYRSGEVAYKDRLFKLI